MTRLRQWRAYEACYEQGLTQEEAGLKFGVSQQAISSRIKRYFAARGERPRSGSRRRVVTVVSCSQFAEL
jgi:DNA-directed RNA polymerase specialized sigma24 family protein